MKNMIHKTETRTVTTEEIESITCDLCKQTYRGEEWGAKTYETLDVTVEFKKGDSYPGSGDHTILIYDVCPACFMGKLVPAMKEMGAGDPHREDRSW